MDGIAYAAWLIAQADHCAGIGLPPARLQNQRQLPSKACGSAMKRPGTGTVAKVSLAETLPPGTVCEQGV